MTAKDGLTLALRVLGFWLLISAVGTMASLVASTGPLPRAQRMEILLTAGTATLVEASLAALLLLYAAGLARWFEERRSTSNVTQPAPTTLWDAYQVAARVLGLYAASHAIGPLGRILGQILGDLLLPPFGVFSPGHIYGPYLVEAIADLGYAALLLFRSDWIASLFVRTHHVIQAPHPLDQIGEAP